MWNAINLVQDWTSVAVSISYDDNHYTTGTSMIYLIVSYAVATNHFTKVFDRQ